MELPAKTDIVLLVAAIALLAVVCFRLASVRTLTTSSTPSLGVQQLVRQLSDELQALDEQRRRDRSESAGFLRLGDATIEVSFVVKASSSAKATAELEVVTLEGGRELSREQVQKLSIKLLPISRKGSTPPEEQGNSKKE